MSYGRDVFCQVFVQYPRRVLCVRSFVYDIFCMSGCSLFETWVVRHGTSLMGRQWVSVSRAEH